MEGMRRRGEGRGRGDRGKKEERCVCQSRLEVQADRRELAKGGWNRRSRQVLSEKVVIATTARLTVDRRRSREKQMIDKTR